jgi:hypothetical protein
VRTQRRRKKKLIVAFHFQFANQAAWKCDTCRKSGLEKKRRCGWLGDAAPGGLEVIWARGKTAAGSCPRSYITPESASLLEEFHAWKLIGVSDVYRLPARVVEAIFILENELRLEKQDASR